MIIFLVCCDVLDQSANYWRRSPSSVVWPTASTSSTHSTPIARPGMAMCEIESLRWTGGRDRVGLLLAVAAAMQCKCSIASGISNSMYISQVVPQAGSCPGPAKDDRALKFQAILGPWPMSIWAWNFDCPMCLLLCVPSVTPNVLVAGREASMLLKLTLHAQLHENASASNHRIMRTASSMALDTLNSDNKDTRKSQKEMQASCLDMIVCRVWSGSLGLSGQKIWPMPDLWHARVRLGLSLHV